MGFQAYRHVFAASAVRRVVLLATAMRVPLWAANIILTLHVITHLHRSYGAAGLLTGVVTVCLMVSGPWRGRRLDRLGLRRSTAPLLAIMALCWSVAPFVGYWALLVVAGVAEFFMMPMFPIARQALIAAVPKELRRSALALDSVFIEITFMVGPVLGVLLATLWSTVWGLLVCQLAVVAAGGLMWLANPPLRKETPPLDAQPLETPPLETSPLETSPLETSPTEGGAQGSVSAAKLGVRGWITPGVVGLFGVSLAATVVLSGTDVGVVAALRSMGSQPSIGWVLAVWGLGSAVGGAVYGALRHRISAFTLLALLAATTIPAALASGPWQLAGLLFIAGLFCAPTVTAVNDQLAHTVPERVLGEAMGWQGAAMMAGSAVGAPIAGGAIDAWGWQAAFLVTGVLSLGAALLGVTAYGRRRAGARERGTPPGELPLEALPLVD